MKREKWVEKIDYGYSAQRSNEAAPAHFLFLLTPKKPTAYSHLCPILLVSLFPLITIQKKFQPPQTKIAQKYRLQSCL